MPDWDNTPPGSKDLSSPADNTPAIPIGAPPPSYINMPSTFTPAFVELTGGGNCLDSLSLGAADDGKILQGTVGGRLKSYQVRAGTDATQLPGIVRCANFANPSNAWVFVQC